MQAALQSSSTLTIRTADARDILLIRTLAHRIWPVCFAPIIAADQIANMLERIYSLANLEKEMDEGHCFWVAFNGGDAAGYVSAYKDGNAVWLKKLYIDPKAQGKGIGRRMLETAVSAFLPATEVRLLVNNGNLPAQEFYTRMGFTRIGEVPVMMGDHAFTDYLYSKPLGPT